MDTEEQVEERYVVSSGVNPKLFTFEVTHVGLAISRKQPVWIVPG